MVPPVRRLLEQADVSYEYVDIYGDPHARERVREINHGDESVPTLIFPDGSTLTEPSLRELRAKLQDMGYEITPPTWTDRIQSVFENPLTRVLGTACLLVGMVSDRQSLIIAGVVILAIGLLAGRIFDDY